jgi:CRP-like cAMP-binding protein
MGFLEQQLKKEYKPNEYIFKDGDPGQTMFIIIEGKVEISKILGDHKTALAVLEKGSIFGEMAIIDREPRSATAMTLANSTLLEISREMFDDRLSKVPPWMQSFFAIMVDRLRRATKNQNILLTTSPGRHIVNLLAIIARQTEPEGTGRVVVEISEVTKLMGFLLGLEDERIASVLRKLADTELCNTARKLNVGRVLVFDNPQELYTLAEFVKQRAMVEDGRLKAMAPEYRFANRFEVELIPVLVHLFETHGTQDDLTVDIIGSALQDKYKRDFKAYLPVLTSYVNSGMLEHFKPQSGTDAYRMADDTKFEKLSAKFAIIKDLMALEKKINI